MEEKLVSFENTHVESPAEIGDDADKGAVLGCVDIDGYPADENASGRVVCRVWALPGGKFVTDWHDNSYRLNKSVLELVEDSKKLLLESFGQDPAPATEREGAILDWMFRNAHSCPFADHCGIDFDAECKGFGTDGCRECVLKNIAEYGRKSD